MRTTTVDDQQYTLSAKSGLYVPHKRPPPLVHPLYYITPEGYAELTASDLWNYPVFHMDLDCEWVMGFTGPRGGGKSLLMAYIVCHNYLLRGRPVWSNIPIRIELFLPESNEVVTAEALPLDTKSIFTLSESLHEGLVVIDELELYAEARRSQSHKNLILNYIVMQTRKRALSFAYTIQQPEWVDNRLRFMSDVVLRCRDIAFTPWGFENEINRGDYFSLVLEDWSGNLTGQKYYESGATYTFCMWGRPVWGMYNSYDIVDVWDALTPIDLQLQRMRISTGDMDTGAQGLVDTINEKVAALRLSGYEHVKDSELWELLNVPEKQKRAAGAALKAMGVKKKQRRDGYYYVLPSDYVDMET